MFSSKKLSKLSNIKHGFFNRNGGKSKGIYKSLNCGLGSDDNNLNILKNLKIAQSKIYKSSKKIFLLKQIHSNKFVFINNNSKINNKKNVEADAIITNQRKLPIGVLTADCVPLLVCDKKKKYDCLYPRWMERRL